MFSILTSLFKVGSSYGYIIGAATIFLTTLAGGGYLYYKTTESKINELQNQNARYESREIELTRTIADNKRVYERLADRLDEQEVIENELQIRLSIAEDYSDSLLRKLRRHDLVYLSISKPGLIETRINNGTEKLFDDIESFTRD